MAFRMYGRDTSGQMVELDRPADMAHLRRIAAGIGRDRVKRPRLKKVADGEWFCSDGVMATRDADRDTANFEWWCIRLSHMGRIA